LTNSPFFHLNFDGCANVTIDGLVVYVDTKRQQTLRDKHTGLLELLKDKLLSHLPIFPLNTDGIDPSGINFLIRNYTYTGFDDAIAVKPSRIGSPFTNCTQNLLMDGAKVHFSTGRKKALCTDDNLTFYY
jgi:hypothetical protein